MKFSALLPYTPNFSGDIFQAQHTMAHPDPRDLSVRLEAEDMDDVFTQLNHGSGRELPGYKGRSLSVGDLILNEATLETYMVSAEGFTKIS